MTHILIMPTWKCQNHCRYCWMDYTVRSRPQMYEALERPAEDWIAAINRAPVFVDIAGGEPLLYKDLYKIIAGCPKTQFGLSTNGMNLEAVKQLCEVRYPKLGSINLSLHSDCQLPDYIERYKQAYSMFKAAGYPVFSSLVMYKDELRQAAPLAAWIRRQGGYVTESPYEDMRPEARPHQPPLECLAGINGFVVAPDGLTWPCLGAMWDPAWKTASIGNFIDGTVDTAKVPSPCSYYCESYNYLVSGHPAGDMWNTKVREYTGASKA